MPRTDRPEATAILEEAEEVGWLLGNQFQLGVVEGSEGPLALLAGESKSVRDQGIAAVQAAWTFAPDESAEVVVVGLGSPGRSGGIDEIAAGLATAQAALVARSGKIVVLSRATGPLGPACRRLAEADDPRAAADLIRELESEPDYPAALQISRALSRADLYLLSDLDEDDAETLGAIPLSRPEEARRLVSSAASLLLVSQADRVRVPTTLDGAGPTP